MEDQEIEVLIELMKSLTIEDIKMLHKSLHVPGGVCDDECEPIDFLAAMYKWEYLDPYIFHLVLKTIRPDLISKALNVPWLCVPLYPHHTKSERPYEQILPFTSLIEMLKREISICQLKRIYNAYKKVSLGESDEEVGFENTMKLLLENNMIQKDFTRLSQLMENIELHKVVQELKMYKKEFKDMPEHVFTSEFREELENLDANLPYEIKVRGNEFTWEYYKACDEGSLELKFFRLMIVGPEGAGKTSLLKALKGLCFDENEISTDFIEKTDITITDLNKDWSESVNFKKQLQETRDDIVAKITVENVRELAKSSGESKLDSPKEDDGRILTDLPVNEESVSKVDSKSHSLTHEYIKSKFSKIMHKNLPLWREMHKRWKNEHTMDPIDFSTVWDLAGQSYLFCMHSLCDVINFCFIMLLLMVCQQFSYYPSFQDIMSGLYASKSY